VQSAFWVQFGGVQFGHFGANLGVLGVFGFWGIFRVLGVFSLMMRFPMIDRLLV